MRNYWSSKSGTVNPFKPVKIGRSSIERKSREQEHADKIWEEFFMNDKKMKKHGKYINKKENIFKTNKNIEYLLKQVKKEYDIEPQTEAILRMYLVDTVRNWYDYNKYGDKEMERLAGERMED